MFTEKDIVYSYTREQALEDGVLVDVSELAKEAGFTVPVAITSTVSKTVVAVSKDLQEMGQSETGRLWDILMVLRFQAKDRSGSIFHLSVMVQHKEEGPAEEV